MARSATETNLGYLSHSSDFFCKLPQNLSISFWHIRYWPRCTYKQMERGEFSCHNMCFCYTTTAKPGRS